MATTEHEAGVTDLGAKRDRREALEAIRQRVREKSRVRSWESVEMPRWGLTVHMGSVNVEEQRRIFSLGYRQAEKFDPHSGLSSTVSEQTPDLYPLAIGASAHVEVDGEREPLIPRGASEKESLEMAREFVNGMDGRDANRLFKAFLRAIGETREQREEGKDESSAASSNTTAAD